MKKDSTTSFIFGMGILLFCYEAIGSPINTANEYLDTVLYPILKDNIHSSNLEPAKLPDFETEFRHKFLFVTSRVRTSYTSGLLRNLARVARLGDCVPTRDLKSIECTLQFNHLRVEYNAKFKYGKLPKFPIRAKSTVRPVDAKISIGIKDGVPPVLNSIELISGVNLDVSYKGMGPLNRNLRILKSGFVEKAHKIVEDVIKNDFKDVLRRSISETRFEL